MDLLRPVYVRDVPINAVGYVDNCCKGCECMNEDEECIREDKCHVVAEYHPLAGCGVKKFVERLSEKTEVK